MKLDRLLSITMMLINRKRMSARELAEHFEVSVRTILRDIETINQAGIPIVSYQGIHGGFGIMENYKIDRSVLTPDEVLSIVMALKGVNTALEDKKISAVLEKVQTLIPQSQSSQDRVGSQWVIDFSPWGSNKAQKDKLDMVRQAMEACRLLAFDYTNAQGISARRVTEPLGLSFKGYSWYLYAYCHTKEDFRIFKLSRMKKLRIEDAIFVKGRILPEAQSWDTGTGSDRPWVDLVLRFKPRVRVRVEDYFDQEQIRIEEDGSAIVHVTWSEDDWVYGTILSYGDDVEVLEPPHMRETIREKGKKIWELYSNI